MEFFEELNAQRTQYIKQQVILNDKESCQNIPNDGKNREFSKNKMQTIFNGTRTEFYNYDFMTWLACSIQGTFTLSKSVDNDIYVNVDRLADIRRVREYITRLQKIGEASVSGDVFNTELPLVIKVAQFGKDRVNLELFHEFFVGMQLNKLRSNFFNSDGNFGGAGVPGKPGTSAVPNFMFVYGLFRCEMVRGADHFCRSFSDPANYLLIEKITGPSILELFLAYMNDGRDQLVLSMIVQIICALHIAYTRTNFCHYDLHLGNILVRNLTEIIYSRPNVIPRKNDFVYIPYFAEKMNFYVKAKVLPTIIDYGRAHVNDQYGNSYGNYMTENPDVEPLNARPICDLYKFVGFVALVASRLGNVKWIHLMRFFEFQQYDEDDAPYIDELNDNELKQFIDEELPERFSIGDRMRDFETPERKKTTYLSFLAFLKRDYKEEWNVVVQEGAKPNDAPELSCFDLNCNF